MTASYVHKLVKSRPLEVAGNIRMVLRESLDEDKAREFVFSSANALEALEARLVETPVAAHLGARRFFDVIETAGMASATFGSIQDKKYFSDVMSLATRVRDRSATLASPEQLTELVRMMELDACLHSDFNLAKTILEKLDATEEGRNASRIPLGSRDQSHDRISIIGGAIGLVILLASAYFGFQVLGLVGLFVGSLAGLVVAAIVLSPAFVSEDLKVADLHDELRRVTKLLNTVGVEAQEALEHPSKANARLEEARGRTSKYFADLMNPYP